MADLPIPPEPTKEQLEKMPETIYVLWFSGDWDDLPAVYKLSNYCKDWCPLMKEYILRKALK